MDEEGGARKEVQVKVLVKRGNKQQTKQMYIPQDSSLVQSTKQKEAAELEEKQDIKRLVLEYNDREEEELNGLGTQSLNWSQSGAGRVISRGNNWEAGGGRTVGTRHRHLNYPGGGVIIVGRDEYFPRLKSMKARCYFGPTCPSDIGEVTAIWSLWD